MTCQITASNRLRVTLAADGGTPPLERRAGGLITGLRRLNQASDSLWIGHPETHSAWLAES
ncbi:MAG: hypothetical protein ABI625_06970 [bacterium]